MTTGEASGGCGGWRTGKGDGIAVPPSSIILVFPALSDTLFFHKTFHPTNNSNGSPLICAWSKCLVGKTLDQHESCLGVRTGGLSAIKKQSGRSGIFYFLPMGEAHEVIPRLTTADVWLLRTSG